MIPPLPNIDDYQVSADNGFLPAEPPLSKLPDTYYGPWEDIVSIIPDLIAGGEIRRVVDEMPVLSTVRLKSEAEWRRAFVVLGFISNSYIWGVEQAKDRLPQCIAIPFLEVSEYLELPPVPTYAALCLWNFRSIYPGHIDIVENLASLCSFTGTVDEAWFYLVSVAIEARGAPTIPLMIEAIQAARNDDSLTVTECLTIFAERITDLRELLGRMTEHCSPHAFYFQIRPFLAGSKNMAGAGLPNGVLFEDGSGKEIYRNYSGGSNAQSSLIQFFDIVLGVQHRPTGVRRDPPSAEKLEGHAPPPKHNFIEEMRSYMPGPHRRFLEHLTTVANTHDYVMANPENLALVTAYDECLRALSSFRDKHLQIVTRYIVIMSQKSKRKAEAAVASSSAPARSMAIPVNFPGLAKGDAAEGGLKGTGGTQLMPFLKQSRDETTEPGTGSWIRASSRFKSLHDRSTTTSSSATATATAATTPTPSLINSPISFAARSCKVNDFEDKPAARTTGVDMAGDWEVGDDVGGLCHC